MLGTSLLDSQTSTKSLLCMDDHQYWHSSGEKIVENSYSAIVFTLKVLFSQYLENICHFLLVSIYSDEKPSVILIVSPISKVAVFKIFFLCL